MEYSATNAKSSGVSLPRSSLKQLATRRDVPGLLWLAWWVTSLMLSGAALAVTLGSWLVVPAMIVYGSLLALPAYALSHETAHGTAFRTRWLNETVFLISSFLYVGEPYHRRYAHTSHHTNTWHIGKDGQMPFDTPMSFSGWAWELTGIPTLWYEGKIIVLHSFRKFSPTILSYTPENELGRLTWSARAYLILYILIIGLSVTWLPEFLVFLIIPRLVGGIALQVYTVLQHVELEENSPSILNSTRSFKTNVIGRLLYMNMNHHLGHHLYTQVPFFALPDLEKELGDQLPDPDPGVLRSNLDLFCVTLRRSLGKNTKASSLRQAPHMITTGSYAPIAKASMR
ncbi:fatty acid desaturase [Hwanghaeella sp. 1Z406]|uniref:fatty acid desaturase n=1 Tax=Hwanghaeella sp. 1Z406 TaxID=3402811 RepID=UPI00267AB758